MTDIFGFFDKSDQVKPAFDPGLDVPCPFCLGTLERPLKTISLMLPGDARSFFYRAHKACYDDATPEATSQIESAQIDTRARLAANKGGE